MAATLVFAGLLASPAPAAQLISEHKDWKAYSHGSGKEQVCFAAVAAESQQPNVASRRQPHVYVTSWPKQGVKTEVSVFLGFEAKADSEIKVDIGGNAFMLFSDGDRGFVADPADEARLLDAMRRGAKMTVEAVSSDGANSKDVFSLSGVTDSIKVISSGC